MEKENRILKIQDLIMYFFACGCLGWLMEVAYAFSVYGKFVDRGFLHGPICPIYGCGAVVMVLITNFIKKKNVKNTFFMFVIITVIATLLEYLASLILELIFHLRWWDYSEYFLNLNGRICFIFSIFFGIAGIVFIKAIYSKIQQIIKKIRKKMSPKKITIILIILISLIVIDTTFSCIKYAKIEIANLDPHVVLIK